MAESSLTDLIVQIYDLVIKRPLATFKSDALAMIAESLDFDTAIWASGVHRSNTIFSIATHRFAPAALMDYAAHWQTEDMLRSAVVASPGRALRNEDIMPVEAHRASAIYQRFCAPGGMHQTLGVASADLVTTVGELIFLFRSGEDRAYRDEERDHLDLLAPHLFAAWRQRQALGLFDAGAEDAANTLTSYAVVDDDGLIHAADVAFSACVARAFPGWNGPLLPDGLRSPVTNGQAIHVERQHRFRLRHGTGRHLVIAAGQRRERLTAAEHRTAKLFADGETYSAIAARLGLSPSTIRNQIAAAYRKLGVRNKVALIQELAKDSFPG
jgi:DNA-binding CsgD family transcriptional regulator